jgi:cytochrome c
MKRIVLLALGGALFVLLTLDTNLIGAERGTTIQAKTMLLKALAHYKEVGREQALGDFTAKKPPFGDHDLYVVCFDRERLVVANGGFAGDVGTRGDMLVDLNGKGVATVAWEVSTAGALGVVSYRWINPATHSLETKTMFVARIGNDVCGVGTYRP